MPQGRYSLGFLARMPGLRSCRLLRLVSRQARDEALPRNPASCDAFGHAWGPLDLVLYTRSCRRTLAGRSDDQKKGPSSMTTSNYDVIVIGAGSTGENVADRAV